VKFLSPYKSIKNFLYRFTILQIGKLHIRIHRFDGQDKTTLFHNHPFHYISIILWGGYTERIKCGNVSRLKVNVIGDVIFRRSKVYHRIDDVYPNTYTLFIAYGDYTWNAINMQKSFLPNGIFSRKVNNKSVWAKRENGIWFIGNESRDLALVENRHSIYQI
jgi:hypothetical protein